jgi:hypothetical protein
MLKGMLLEKQSMVNKLLKESSLLNVKNNVVKLLTQRQRDSSPVLFKNF